MPPGGIRASAQCGGQTLASEASSKLQNQLDKPLFRGGEVSDFSKFFEFIKGFAVIDFMNVDYVIANLIPSEIKTVDGIDFHIKRYVKDNHIFKEIDFEDKGEKFHFTEKVQALRLADFEAMMEEAGIYLLDVFGDYKLKTFYKNQSGRLIMIFK